MTVRTVGIVETHLDDVFLLEIRSSNLQIVHQELQLIRDKLTGMGILLSKEVCNNIDILKVVTEVLNAKWFAEYNQVTTFYTILRSNNEVNKPGDIRQACLFKSGETNPLVGFYSKPIYLAE